MTASVVYVGMDVHKETIASAVLREGRTLAEKWKTLPNDGVRRRKAVWTRGKENDVSRGHCAAGPTGFGLFQGRRKAGREYPGSRRRHPGTGGHGGRADSPSPAYFAGKKDENRKPFLLR